MTNKKKLSDIQLHRAHDYLLLLGNLTTKFAEVRRAPRYPSGMRESDVEHSFHLALSAVELAREFYPKLDIGLVAQFSLVHDMPEVYAGDVWTFKISPEDRAKKEAAEQLATKKLLKQLPPHTAHLLERYEEQQEPEARFVRFVDKLMPVVINALAGDANTFIEDYKLSSINDLIESREHHKEELKERFPEFDAIHILNSLLLDTASRHVIENTNHPDLFV